MSGVKNDHLRVLTIQSHTVRGHVGNKSAVFPLQLLGLEVDPINSVQFSNHTGYKTFRGQRLGGEELLQLIEGLEANDLLSGYTHLLTGYIGSLSFLRSITSVYDKLLAHNPNLVYVCDPVLGDGGKLYVPPELVDAYRDEVVPKALLLTPNQFEAELLTGTKIQSEKDALAACDLLHAKGPATVIITSAEFPGPENEGVIVLIASTKVPQEAGLPQRFRLRMPKLPMYFTGTGDLVAALLLARTADSPGRLVHAVELAIASVQGALANTAAAIVAAGGEGASTAARELRLVQSQEEIKNPVVKFKCEPL